VNTRITPLVPGGTGGRGSRSGRSNRGVARVAGATANVDLPQSYIFDVAILGYPVCISTPQHMLLNVFQLVGPDIINDDVFLRKLWAHRVPELLEHMSNHHLLLSINTTALPSDNVTAFFSRTIHDHLSMYNLLMPPSTRPPVAPQDGQLLDHSNFYQNPWQLAVIGY
jgi:hypothetical protein